MSDIAFSVLIGNGYDDIIFKTIMLKGDKGNSIASIEKTSTSGKVDTYTITLTDGTIGGTFTVTNGEDGAPVNIDDNVTASDKTWSSQKLSGMIKEIDDSDVDADKLWSSEKINSLIPQTATIEDVAVASFSDGADNVPVSELIVDIEAYQAGSGDASPSNVRAISGREECNITKSGKNLLDKSTIIQGAINTSDGTINTSSTTRVTSDYIVVKNNTSFAFSIESGKKFVAFHLYDKEKVGIGQNLTTNPITINNANAKYIRVVMGFDDNSDISPSDVLTPQLEFGSTATTFEEFNGGIDTIDLAQEVCGGALNVTTGLLTISHKKYTYDGTEDGWKKSGTYDGSFYINTGDAHIKDESDICSHAIFTQSFGEYVYGKFALDGNNNPNLNVFVQETGIDLPTFKSWLATQYANGTPLTAVLRLANNVTIQLTPTEVKTLLGTNNIFADTGDINELVYFKAGSEAVARLIEAYMRS